MTQLLVWYSRGLGSVACNFFKYTFSLWRELFGFQALKIKFNNPIREMHSHNYLTSTKEAVKDTAVNRFCQKYLPFFFFRKDFWRVVFKFLCNRRRVLHNIDSSQLTGRTFSSQNLGLPGLEVKIFMSWSFMIFHHPRRKLAFLC